MLITADQIISWRPCPDYPDGRVRQLVPGQGLTPLEIAALEIPHADRVWVLLRPEVLGEQGLQVALDRIAVRTVTNHALHCRVPVVEGWAQRWLDGTDRTEAPATGTAVPATRWLPLAGFLGLIGDAGDLEHMLQLYDIVHVLEGRP